MNRLLGLIVIVAALLSAGLAFTQEQGHLNVRTVVEKEEVTQDASGEVQRRLVPANTVIPGDEVVYTITFTNVSHERADNVVITNPIPEHLTYVDGSAFGPGTVIEFSIDGGRSFAAAEALTITDDGEVRVAKGADYTHVRWVMQGTLDAGAQGMARYRAKLD